MMQYRFMKKMKSILVLFFAFIQVAVFSQTTIATNNEIIAPKPILFGGGIVLGGGSGSFQIGLNPELLKSYNQYVDMGVAMNFYYSSFNPIGGYTIKSRNTQFGMGGFARIWPLEQFFLQVQPEYNWTWTNAKDVSTGVSGNSSVSAPSLLTGVGYGHHNELGMTYFSVMYDLINDIASPYRMGQATAQPIFRAGFGFAIHQRKSKKTIIKPQE